MSKTTTHAGTERRTDEYEIRRYDPADRDAFLSLYGGVFGKQRGTDWFDWRYDGPFAPGVPMAVAECDGELVGAEPFIAFGMRTNGQDVLALQPADAMVHPDHRRRGLLTRMTEFALDRYQNDADFLFNFPNQAAKQAFLDLGWTDLGSLATCYRIQNPATLLESMERSTSRAMVPVVNSLARGYLSVRDATSAPPADVTVSRHETPPAETLAALYDEGVPRKLHARRDAAFYRWRFANPQWTCRTYLAERDGSPVASVVVCTQQTGDVTVTKFMDVLPMVETERYAREISALVSAALDDHAEADVVAASEGTLPRSVLSTHGFHRDDVPPLAWRSTVTQLVARPLGDQASFAGLNVLDSSNWAITFSEQDTSY